VPIKELRKTPPFTDKESRLQLLKQLNSIPNVKLEQESIERWPSIALSILARDSALTKLFDALEWVIEQVTSADTEPPHQDRSEHDG
jgi:hypothetical protein